MSRSEARENARPARHGERMTSSVVVTTAVANCWAMIAHGPPPWSATTTPTAAPQSMPIIVRISTARNAMSRTSSASWVVAIDEIRNVADRAISSGWTSSSP
jgi:hypothetical protein